MSERNNEGCGSYLILMALMAVVIYMVGSEIKTHVDWIRDLQRRVGELEQQVRR